MAKIDMGCGLNTKKPLNDWIHLDGDEGPHIELVCDFADIPLDDNSIDEIWAGDVVEHIPAWKLNTVMTEWKRILKPGGIFGGTTPSLDFNVRQYTEGKIAYDWLIQNLYGDRAGYPHQHYILYNYEHLVKMLLRSGFENIDLGGSPGPQANPHWLVFRCNNPK